MLQKNRIIVVFIILSIYIFGTILSFTGDFIQHFQAVRHQNQIEKIARAQTIEFTFSQWKKFTDTKEIKIENNFYDVVSFRKSNSKIIAKVVKDDFENEIRITFSQIFNKHKLPASGKKKSSPIAKHFNIKLKENVRNLVVLFLKKTSNFDNLTQLKINSFIDLPIKPPC
jgi:hypothetical protein